MNNNKELIEYEKSFITKIKNFFKKIFGKRKKYYNYVQNASTEMEQESQENSNDFIDEIKLDPKVSNNVHKRNNFLAEIEGNEEALNMLSVDRLKKLEEYYDNIILQNEQTIKKLEATA